MTKKLILDLDMGIDDAMALTYAMGSPEVELIGVLASFGNVRVETSARNCLAMLDLLGHPDIPVYMGAAHPSATFETFTPDPNSELIHGHNGIGEANVPDSPYQAIGGSAAGENAAAAFLVDAARTYGTDLIYVPTGPLTNLADALDMDAQAVQGIGRITLMGGALTVPGNMSAGAEANIYADPEAANTVFQSDLRTTVVGLDVTHQVTLTKKETAKWQGNGTMAGCALASMVDYYIDVYARTAPQLNGCALHDPLAVAVAIDPTLIGALPINLRVDLLGEYRGRIIGDPERADDSRKNSLVAITVDKPRFMAEFSARIARALA